MTTDIRWHQRLANFDKALAELTEALALAIQSQFYPAFVALQLSLSTYKQQTNSGQ
ncbi:hypothetical protein [Rheinheimera sp.]|uniref:hypothetical protein n=1 Tax=Rheinheimera sp. TaxID=1869214 RepID=UPI00307D6A69